MLQSMKKYYDKGDVDDDDDDEGRVGGYKTSNKTVKRHQATTCQQGRSRVDPS